MTLMDVLAIEDDIEILGIYCPITNIPIWPLIRVFYIRMILSDLVFHATISGKSSAKTSNSRAILTLAKSTATNIQHLLAGKLKASVCIFSSGVADNLESGLYFNRLSDPFANLLNKDTLTIQDHHDWLYNYPRLNSNLIHHSPMQALSTLNGIISVREHHRKLAQQLVTLIVNRSIRILDWKPGKEQRDKLVEITALKIASMPFQYEMYSKLLQLIKPRLLMVLAGCYGPAAVLIAAAKSLSIVTAEFQHGAVSGGHDAYNFAPTISNSKTYRRTLPDFYLGYGNWWNEQINVPIDKIAIGNPYREKFLAITECSNIKKTDILVLSDGIDFGRYFSLAKKLIRMADNKEWRVVFRLHPLEKNNSAAVTSILNSKVILDQNTSLYSSYKSAHTVISEVSTGLFEAVGLVDNIYMWETDRSIFTYPDHPFETFKSFEMLEILLESSDSKNNTPILSDEIWKAEWSNNYINFLTSIGVKNSG